MTAEESKKLAEEEELAIVNQEQVAVEALFGLFDGVQDNAKSTINEDSVELSNAIEEEQRLLLMMIWIWRK